MTENGQSSSQSEIAGGVQRRRYLTILFADLSHSAHLVANMEAEDYADLAAGLRQTCESIINRHGGRVVQVVGDGVLAAFGLSQAREDDSRRATDAALDLHDAALKLWHGGPLQLHTGIHAGLVLISDGDAVSGPVRLFGTALNIASRLSDAAASGEILISKEALGGERHFFETDSARNLTLPGIDVPVAAYRVSGRASQATRYAARSQRGLVPFVGRSRELRELSNRLARTLGGEPQQLILLGAPGLGKTRLMEEFAARIDLQRAHVYRGYCESYLSAVPIQPFIQILRAVFGLRADMSAAAASDRLQLALSSIDPALSRYFATLNFMLSLAKDAVAASAPAPLEMLTAIAHVFNALAGKRPIVLLIDDWQWADDGSRQVLAAIRRVRRPIYVVLGSRGMSVGDAAMNDVEAVHLAPLNSAETRQTVLHMLPGRDKFLVSDICAYSGGNPLFVEELCHNVAEARNGEQSCRSPDGMAWLNKLIEWRVEQLPSAQIDLVRAAAVIGNIIPSGLLETITGCRLDHPLLVSLAEKDLIYPGEQPQTLRFKHGIVRDVVYASVGLPVRRAMHRRIAGVIRQTASEQPEDANYEALAYHYAAAGKPAEAARYAELAGDKAMLVSALDRVQLQFRAALAALDELPPTADRYRRWMGIVQRLALASVFDPSREQLAVILRAVRLATDFQDPHGSALANYWAGYIYYALGDSDLAVDHLQVALSHAGTAGDAPLVTQIEATLGQARAAACDYAEAATLLDRAIDVKRAHRKSRRPSVGLAYSLACKGSVLGDQGRFADAYHCFEEAIEAVAGAGHEVEGSIDCWYAGVLIWQGRWDEARQRARAAQLVAERVKSLYLFAMSRSLGAYAAWVTGLAPASLAELAEATSWLESRERGLFLSLNHGWLSEAYHEVGDLAAGRRHAGRALRRSRKGDLLGTAAACRSLAKASARRQRGKRFEQYIAQAMRIGDLRGSPHEQAKTLFCDASIKSSLGRAAEARRSLEQAEEQFTALQMAYHLSAAAILRRHL